MKEVGWDWGHSAVFAVFRGVDIPWLISSCQNEVSGSQNS